MRKNDTTKQSRLFLAGLAIMTPLLLVGSSWDNLDKREGRYDERGASEKREGRRLRLWDDLRNSDRREEDPLPGANGWLERPGRLSRNPRLKLTYGPHGVVLDSEVQRASQLVIDVDRQGDCWVANRKVTPEQLQQLVKDRYLEFLDFPCIVRADQHAQHRHVSKVFAACLAGQVEARTQNPKVSGEPKISILALVEAHEDEDVYSRLDVYLPSSDPNSDGSGPWYENIMEVESPSDVLESPPPPEEVESPLEDMEITVEIPTPTVPPVETVDVNAPVSIEPPSFKPAEVGAMEILKESPVKLSDTPGTARSAGQRGRFTSGGAAYGDPTTERAVLMALRWLKATQGPDGSWGTKPELGLTRGMDKAAGAGFAVLTFLAHGETPSSKEFGQTVEKALDYLIGNVYVVKDKNGNEVKDPNGRTPYVKMRGASGSEYGFLIGTYALCEAYAMTGNPNVKAAAEKALRRIIDGQTPTGGWNYNMARMTKDGPDDISYGGWAMQALKAAKMAGIHLEGMDDCIKKAVKCLKTRNYSEKAGFVYRATTNHKGGGGGLAGVGCLAMQLLGYAREPEVMNALNVMKDWQPSLDKEYACVKYGTRHNPQYYCYYAAQCKYQAGMAKNATPANLVLWKKWNAEMKALYPKSIIKVVGKDGKPYKVLDASGKEREIGHWVNGDHYNYDVMGTCLAALQLMVYYRYLPTSSLRATAVEADAESLIKDKAGEIDVGIDI